MFRVGFRSSSSNMLLVELPWYQIHDTIAQETDVANSSSDPESILNGVQVLDEVKSPADDERSGNGRRRRDDRDRPREPDEEHDGEAYVQPSLKADPLAKPNLDPSHPVNIAFERYKGRV